MTIDPIELAKVVLVTTELPNDADMLNIDRVATMFDAARILASALIESEKELSDLKAWLNGPDAPLSLEAAMALQNGRNAARAQLAEAQKRIAQLEADRDKHEELGRQWHADYVGAEIVSVELRKRVAELEVELGRWEKQFREGADIVEAARQRDELDEAQALIQLLGNAGNLIIDAMSVGDAEDFAGEIENWREVWPG